MFHRGPVVITSLEEDFRKIGLISESKDEEVEEQLEETETNDGETVDEGRRVAKALARGSRKVVRTHRTPANMRAKSKRYKKAHKAQIRLTKKKSMRNPKKRRRAAFAAMLRAKRHHESAESTGIAALLEEVQDIVSSIETHEKVATTSEAVKSFANLALIGEMLAKAFEEWSNNLDESYSDQETYDSLAEASETLADLAEAAAEVATGLKEGKEIQPAELETLFKEYMNDVLEGMDLYNEVVSQMDTLKGKAGDVGQSNAIKKKGKVTSSDPTEAKDDDADEEDEDEDEEGDEDDDDEDDTESKSKKMKKEAAADDDAEDDDDDEGDDDEDEGGKKKMPAFIKKKIAAKGEAKADDDEDDDAEEEDEDDDGEDNDEADKDEESKKRPHKR